MNKSSTIGSYFLFLGVVIVTADIITASGPNTRVSEENFERIKRKMKISDVIVVLGEPNGHELLNKRVRVLGDEFSSGWIKYLIKTKRYVGWYGNRFLILVALNGEACVEAKSICPIKIE